MEPLTLMIGGIVLIVLSTGGFIFYQEMQDKVPLKGKSSALKQQEIIVGYQNEMEALLKKYEDDKKICLQEKTRLLHRINKELATNIFFDADEVKAVLNALARYESREV